MGKATDLRGLITKLKAWLGIGITNTSQSKNFAANGDEYRNLLRVGFTRYQTLYHSTGNPEYLQETSRYLEKLENLERELNPD